MASNLVVLSFEGASTAQGMLDNIRDMQARGILELEDAVVAYREPQASKVEFEQLDHNLAPAATQMASQPGINEPVIEQTDSRRKRYAAAGAGAGYLSVCCWAGQSAVRWSAQSSARSKIAASTTNSFAAWPTRSSRIARRSSCS